MKFWPFFLKTTLIGHFEGKRGICFLGQYFLTIFVNKISFYNEKFINTS